MLSILRIMVGLLFLEHGTQKIFNFPPRPQATAFELFTLNPGLAGVLELVGGILITLGLFTRPVAFILSGEMAFAYFMSHAPRGLLSDQHGRQRRRTGDRLLLRLPVFLLRRRRRLEPRPSSGHPGPPEASPRRAAPDRKQLSIAVMPGLRAGHLLQPHGSRSRWPGQARP